MMEKYIFIKNYREKVINFSPENLHKLVPQYRGAGSREVTLPWRLVHRRLSHIFKILISISYKNINVYKCQFYLQSINA